MVNYTGKVGVILIGKESTWGTAVAPTKDIGLVQNFSPSDTNSLQRFNTVGQRNANEIIAGPFEHSANIEFLFQNGRIFEYVFGTVAHSPTGVQVVGKDIKHTFTEADLLPSFTLEDSINAAADINNTYAGEMVDSCTISLNTGGVVTIKADLIGKTVANTTSATAGVISTLPVLPDFMGVLKTGVDASEVTKTGVESFDFTINNNLTKLPGLGSRLYTDMQADERTYEFNFKLAFNAVTDYTNFLGGTAPTATATPGSKSVVFDVTNGLSVDAGLREIFIDCNTCYFQKFGKPTVLKGFVMQDFVGWAKGITQFYTYDNLDDQATEW